MTQKQEDICLKETNEECDSKATTKPTKSLSINSNSPITLEINETIKENRNDYERNESMPLLSKKNIMANLKKIFMSYAKYNSKENDYFITQLIVNKLLKQSNILIDCGIKLYKVDLLYKKICPLNTKMHLERFMTFVIRLPQQLYPEEFEINPKEIVDSFLYNFLHKINTVISSNETITHNEISEFNPNSIIKFSPDQKQRFIIFNVFLTITELYNKYFDYSMDYVQKNNVTRKLCLKNITHFLKSFDVFPYILNETYLVTYFNLLIDTNERDYNPETIHNCRVIDSRLNKGKCFTLDNFCLMLIHLSLLSFHKFASYDDNQSDANKLLVFFEGLEHSNGMQRFKQEFNHIIKYTLIPNKNEYTELVHSMEKDKESTTICSEGYSKKITIVSSEMSIKKSIDADEPKDFNDRVKTELSSVDVIDLSRTFLYFCQSGDKSSYDCMNLSDFIRFLEHCKLYYKTINKSRDTTPKKNKTTLNTRNMTKAQSIEIKSMSESVSVNGRNKQLMEANSFYDRQPKTIMNHPYLNESDIGIIISSLTRAKNSNDTNLNSTITSLNQKKETKNQRITFEQFIQSFSLISQRLYPNENPETSLRRLMLHNIIPNVIKDNDQKEKVFNSKIQDAFDILGQPDIQAFLEDLSVITYSFFELYSDSELHMNFTNFRNFYKDFDLFPKMINLIQMKNLIFIFNEKKNNDIEITIENLIIKEYITFDDFIESIAITALLFYSQRECPPIYKLLSLVETLAQSNGYDKIKMKTGRK